MSQKRLAYLLKFVKNLIFFLIALRDLLADQITSDASTYFAGYEQAGGRQNPVVNQLQYGSNESLATSPDISDISDDDAEQHYQDGAPEPPRVDPSVDDENIEDEEEQEEQEDQEEDAEDSDASRNLIEDLGNENTATSSILYAIARTAVQCNEPRAAVERILLSDPPADASDGRHSRFKMLHDFDTREPPVAETSFHNREENGSRIVWNSFNCGSSLDRGVNECKFFTTLFKKISYVRDKIFDLFIYFFFKDIWRRMNYEGSSLPPVHDPHLTLYMRRVVHTRRAQKIRWFHDQAID